MAAIDCLEDEELCEEFTVYSTPKILVFQESYSDDGAAFTGKIDHKSLLSFSTSKMQSFVSIVTSENFDNFMANQPQKHHVILFTERKSTAPLYKALSKSYKDKLVFGETRQSDTVLIEKFKITSFPILLVITDSNEFKGDIYQGEFNIDQMNKFLN